LAAGYFYLKQKQNVQITYLVDKTQLLGSARGVLPEEVTILYKAVKITDLVKFNAIFWNSGTTPIRRQDIIEPMHLCLAAASNLLKASVLKSTRPQNRVILIAVNDTQQMRVDFEYLEPRQGFNVELLVTGEITDDPAPTGTIIGMPRGFTKFNAQHSDNLGTFIVVVFSIPFLGVVVGILYVLNIVNEITVGILVTVWAWLSIVLINAFSKWWPRGIPRDLRT